MINRGNIKRFIPWALLIAVVCAFLRSLPLFGACPDENLLLSTVRGLAAQWHLQDFNPASVQDRVFGWLWLLGGASPLGWGVWALTFLGWALAFFVVLIALKAFLQLLPDKRVRTILFGTTLLLIFAVCVPTTWQGIFQRSRRISNIELVAPVTLCRQTKGQAAVFASPSALPYFVLFAPEFAAKLSPFESVRLSKDPSTWRKLQRQNQWSAVVLSGGRSDEYRPLLDHLMASPDWHLAAIDNFGYLFLSGGGPPVAMPDVHTLRRATDNETAIYLAQIAGYLDAIRKTSDARAAMERALQLAPQDITVLGNAASFFAERKRWQDAIAYCDRAMEINPDHAYAKIVKSLALIELREPQKAYGLLNEVPIQLPNDPYTLFLQARVCRSIHDYAAEARILERLLLLPRQTPEAVAYYHLYLGQAYAKQGFAEPALKNYRAALDSGRISEEQVTDVRDQIQAIDAKKFP